MTLVLPFWVAVLETGWALQVRSAFSRRSQSGCQLPWCPKGGCLVLSRRKDQFQSSPGFWFLEFLRHTGGSVLPTSSRNPPPGCACPASAFVILMRGGHIELEPALMTSLPFDHLQTPDFHRHWSLDSGVCVWGGGQG